VERQGLTGFELLVLGFGGIAAVVVGVVWGGAALALLVTGHDPGLSVSAATEALGNLPGHLSDPAAAWREPSSSRLPGPVVYWLCSGAVVVAVISLGVVLVRWSTGSKVGTSKRRPLGVDARPRFARARDLAPLLVRSAQPGRFVVARFGRRLVATEATPTAGEKRGARRGDRGALALVGPSRSGKTTAAVSGILEWDGPAVLSSVKADLLGATQGWRSQLGHVHVYDPTGSTGTVTAVWSPLDQAGAVLGAQRAARALCDAAPRGGVEGGLDFWLAQAEILLTGLLFVAHHTSRDMGAVCEWILLQDRPGELGPGEVRVALDELLAWHDGDVIGDAVEVSRALVAIWNMEDRTRSSVYATAQTVVWPWSDPGVAASSAGDSVKLDWLIGGPNTLYLCAPIEDQKRLAPAFGGLLNDLIAQAYRHVARTGEPLDPPLLIVIDEAGNTPLRALPEYASTLAGIGVLLVTIWQSLAQVEAAYQRQADTILTNHLTKLFYAGLSDPASIRYVGQVLGDAEVETSSRSGVERLGGASTQLSTTRVALTPPHALRQMRPGDALMVHGTLPPAHVRTRAYYRDRVLSARAAEPVREPPTDPDDATHSGARHEEVAW
jgi:type IV secretion system protein VirD4